MVMIFSVMALEFQIRPLTPKSYVLATILGCLPILHIIYKDIVQENVSILVHKICIWVSLASSPFA